MKSLKDKRGEARAAGRRYRRALRAHRDSMPVTWFRGLPFRTPVGDEQILAEAMRLRAIWISKVVP